MTDRRRAHLLGRLRGARLGPGARPGDGARRDGRAGHHRDRARPARLPADRPGPSCATLLAEHGLGLVGGFLASRCTTRQSGGHATPTGARASCSPRGGAEVLVLAAATGLDGYDERPALTDDEWATLVETAGLVRDRAARRRAADRAAPARRHARRDHRRGRAVPRRLRPAAVRRHRSPADRRHRPRRAGARATRTGSATCTSRTSARTSPTRCGTGGIGYTEAVAQGIYVPLGDGDVDLAELLKLLRDNELRRLVRARAGHRARRARHRRRPPAAAGHRAQPGV